MQRHGDPTAVLGRAVAALGGEDRPGQRRLAEAVGQALESRHHLLAEAPTGSGKSLAYLVPVLTSERTAVIATATLALQDQLWHKDLPHLREHSGLSFTAALLKGRSNYLCVAKVAAAQGETALFDERPGPDFARDLTRLARFAAQSPTGDVADLDVDVEATSWRALTCGPNECPGAARCEHADDCFAERARERAEHVDVVVVNHSLYCAHLATGARLLPAHEVVVFDEAHALDRVATSAFGAELTAGGLRQVAARLRRAGAPPRSVEALVDSAGRLEQILGDLDGRIDPAEDPLAGLLAPLGEHLADASRGVDREAHGPVADLAARLGTTRLEAVRRFQTPTEGEVAWVEGAPNPVLRVAPVDAGADLARVLFARVPAVLVSATLGPGARFEPLARRLGLDPAAPEDSEELGRGYVALRVESPFDHRSQARLYVPRHIPDVRDAAWQGAAADELCSLVEAAGGRALVLCTSWRSVNEFSAVLRERTSHTILAQGDQPVPRLVAGFADDETSCLVATRAFWMGLDVPGPACVLVVIDRLPFTRPDEPLEQARREAAERAGGNGFLDVDLPNAALVLAQGAGRLIRRKDDHGVVAVLDRRLATARYRSVLLEGLPPMRRIVEADEAHEFLARATALRSRSDHEKPQSSGT